jgi:hypothetical protein
MQINKIGLTFVILSAITFKKLLTNVIELRLPVSPGREIRPCRAPREHSNYREASGFFWRLLFV